MGRHLEDVIEATPDPIRIGQVREREDFHAQQEGVVVLLVGPAEPCPRAQFRRCLHLDTCFGDGDPRADEELMEAICRLVQSPSRDPAGKAAHVPGTVKVMPL